MLRLLCRQATFILMFSIGNKALQIDPDNYVPFLSDIQDYYKSSGVFLLYDDNSENFSTKTNIAAFLHKFSSRGIKSQAIHYSKIENKTDFFLWRNMQSLFVIFLTSKGNYDHFSTVTENHDMSFYTWLVIFTEHISDDIDNVCQNPVGNPFHLVFNSRMIVKCYEEDTINKWYSLNHDRTEVLELAKWSRKLGINYKNKNYYERRYDMFGKTMRIATHTNATSVTNGKMTGFFEQIIDELKNYMNFSVDRAKEVDAFGKWNPQTNKWSGLIGLLTTRKVDLVVAPITISKFRMDFIEFTRPLLISANRIYIKQPAGARIQWSAYFRAFDVASWSSILFMLIIASLTTAFIRLILTESKFIQISGDYVLENFIRIWGIYCQQGVPEFPRATPLRLAYFTILLLTLVIWAIYSASITSYLTVLTPSLPFSDTEGFVKDGSYRLIVLQNSSDYDIIFSGRDPILSTLQPLLKSPDELPTNPFMGFQQVCNERIGFYASEAILNGVSGYIPCTLTYIETGQFECLAMALVKRSPYVTSINYNLRKLEDNGVVKKLKNWYFHKMNNVVDVKRSAIGVWSIAPLLTIFAGGITFSVSILFLENLYYLSFRKRMEQRNS